MCVISVCGLCCDGEDSVCSAVVMVLWRTSWYLVLLAFILFHSSDDCIEDCISVSPSDGDTIRVGALLECSLLDCFEECTSVSSSEGDTIRVGALLDCSLLDCVEDCTSVTSSEDDTIRVWALLESSLLECSSPELRGSVRTPESELAEAERWECRVRGTVSATPAA